MASIPQRKVPTPPATPTETKIFPSKIGNVEWAIVVIALACTDGVQLLLDLFEIGFVANRIGDFLIGFGLFLYLWIRGELRDPVARKRIYMVLFATFVVEELIPFADSGPFWFLDGLYFWYLAIKRNEKARLQSLRKKEVNKNLTAYEKRMKIEYLQERKLQTQSEKREIMEEERAMAPQQNEDNMDYS